MKDKDRVIKHLEIIQNVINRLAHNSFLIKGWSMTILVAIILFIGNTQNCYSQYIILCCLIPIVVFWILDAYFLFQERLFRGIYNDVRKQKKTDFGMNIPTQRNKPKCKWYNSFFSITLVSFYSIESIFIVVVFFILNFYIN